MKTIGLLGGMSWESTIGYYRAINEGVKEVLGGFHSAKIMLYSVDFDPIEKMLSQGDWDGTARILTVAAQKLQVAGADFLVICTNTMHRVAPQIEAAIEIPLLHIADATAQRLIDDGIRKVGLLGTAYTMEQEFYMGRLQRRHGLEVVIPDAEDRELVHDVIFNELCMGKIETRSRERFLDIIHRLVQEGAEAVILGCTEIGMLVRQKDTDSKLYDTTVIHAEKAVESAMGD